MENEQGNTGAVDTGGIESQITGLRQKIDGMDRLDPQYKEAREQLSGLYKQKCGDGLVENTAQTISAVAKPSDKPESADLPKQAQAELDKLAELGYNVGDVDRDDLSPERVEGFKQLRLYEEGKFDELGASLSGCAYRAGMPAKNVWFLRNFLREVAQPDDPLSRDIINVVIHHIYQNRKR